MAVMTGEIPYIEVEGLSMDGYTVTDVDVEKGLLTPSRMRFTMRRKTLLRNEDDVYFDVARSLMGGRVKMRTDTMRRDEEMEEMGEKLTFEGIIFEAENRRDEMGGVGYIDVTAYSADYLLVDNPHCISYENMSLWDIMEEVCREYRGVLKVEVNARLREKLPYTVQYNETNYQFLSRLAQRFGEYLFYDGGRLYFGRTPEGESITLREDTDVLGYRYQLNIEHTDFMHAQHNYLKYENKAANGYDKSQESLHELTDMVFETSHGIYRKRTLQDMHSTSQEYSSFAQNELSAAAEGLGAKARMMTCRVRTNRGGICIGDRITICEKIDERRIMEVEHQEMLVVGVKYHSTINGHFEGELTAVPSESLYAPYGVEDLYPVCESQRGLVVDNRDPEGLGRIRVQFLWQQMQGGGSTPWIRITQPHGGDDKGFYMIPEIGEEVMVAFENGNGEKPYVVGTLYHGKQQPGKGWPDSQNNIKAIRTRNGHTVEIHDEGGGGYIRIYDYNKENYILTYSTDEKLIKLESKGNIELYADNDIIMHAGHDINVHAGNDETRNIDRNRSTHIGNDDTLNVDANKKDTVGKNRFDTIEANHQVTVSDNQIVNIKGDRTTSITNLDKLSANDLEETIKDEAYLKASVINEEAREKINQEARMEVNIKALKVKLN